MTLTRPFRLILMFAAIGLAWRVAFLPVNQGSYTDGILQIDCFRQGLTFWPPLFALLARLFAWIPGLGLEGAGRLVAMLCGAAAMAPLGVIAQRLFGFRAAIWTMVAWLASPMALRWSLQPMTDMPMTCIWLVSICLLVLAVEQYLPGLFPPHEPPLQMNAAQGFRYLLLASLSAALATLTRYQGILLLPPLILAAWWLRPIGRAAVGRVPDSLLSLLPWLAVPAWLLRQGPGPLLNHFEQIGARSSPLGFGATFVQVYWYMFEEFLLKSPYFITYGIFGFMLFGLFRTQWGTARLRWFAWLSLYLTLVVLVLQSIFSSYQSRYLLPLLPLVCLFAGHGFATWERRTEGRRGYFWLVAGPAIAFGLFFSTLVGVSQGNPFKDIKDAARYLRDEVKPPANARVLTNELYGSMQLIGPKLRFWSGHDNLAYLAPPLMPGDYIVLSAYDAASDTLYQRQLQGLIESGNARVLKRFSRSALPLDPDVMQEAITHQNPLAWQLRYREQRFETTVLQVKGSREPSTPTPDDAATSPALSIGTDAKYDQLLQEMKTLQKEIQREKESLQQ